MYPLDRRKLAQHVYLLFGSLRKTGLVLQASHTTIARWLKNPEAKYPENRRGPRKTIQLAIHHDPFISLFSLKKMIQQVHSMDVSRELLRTFIRKQGFTKKKPKFFSKPAHQADKVKQFLEKRSQFGTCDNIIYYAQPRNIGIIQMVKIMCSKIGTDRMVVGYDSDDAYLIAKVVQRFIPQIKIRSQRFFTCSQELERDMSFIEIYTFMSDDT